MTKRKFYKTTIIFEVLSEEKIPDNMTLLEIYQESIDGLYSGRDWTEAIQELDGKEAAQALLAQGSAPEFFCLDEEGNSTEDEEE